VSFTTKLPERYQVQEDPLVVPASLARYGLSEVVNRLLGLEKLAPFDFVINGEFLRTDLHGYLDAKKLSSEKVLRLEYILALTEPEQTHVDEFPDWVSSVVALGHVPADWFAASSYDGSVRVYKAGSAKLTAQISDASLTACTALPASPDGDVSFFAAASKDGIVRCSRLQLGAKPALGPVSSMRSPAHTGALQTLALNEDASLLAGGGWDHDILVWNAGLSSFAESDEMQQTSGSVKRKAAGTADIEVPKLVLKGHSQVISCVQFGARARYPFTLLSGSWDSTVRVWDVVAASCVCNWTVARAVTSFSMSPGSPPQMATSHEDGHVSLWDIRAPPHPTVQHALSLDASAGLPLASAQSPHRRLASQVAWCPLDAQRLASAGHDGSVCVLDPRSPRMPLQRVRLGKPGPVPTKMLCLTWLSRDEIAVGGSDGKVVRLSLTQAGGE